jgi:hypothetical protein
MYSNELAVILFLSDFIETRLSKYIQIPNLMNIRPVAAESFHVDRWMGMEKLVVTFQNFANMPKNW